MDRSTSGSFRLFRAFGIDVYLHWTWFLIAWLQVSWRQDVYQMPVLKAVEYLSLFLIVLLHEFGHALACRSVGGHAERIVLWPLGGIAYVAPPARPGAYLWSIAAGPLVNLLLVPILGGLWWLGRGADWAETHPDAFTFLSTMAEVNGWLLVLNLLPIYPLDGGQILQALLWYNLGRWRSLQAVSIVGFGLGGFCLLLTLFGSLQLAAANQPAASAGLALTGLIAAYIAYRSLIGFQFARTALMLLELPRHDDCACPQCGVGPPRGSYWVCDHCQTRFDLFDARGQCPGCGAWYLHPDCPHCRHSEHVDRWYARPGEPVVQAPPAHEHAPPG